MYRVPIEDEVTYDLRVLPDIVPATLVKKYCAVRGTNLISFVWAVTMGHVFILFLGEALVCLVFFFLVPVFKS